MSQEKSPEGSRIGQIILTGSLQKSLTFTENSKEKFRVFRAISDTYVRAILNETKNKSKSSQEISKICQIPISTVYRRVQLMHDLGMLEISGAISEKMGKNFFYTKARFNLFLLRLMENWTLR